MAAPYRKSQDGARDAELSGAKGVEATQRRSEAEKTPSDVATESAGLATFLQMIQEAARNGSSGPEIARQIAAYAAGASTFPEEQFIARFTPVLGPDSGGAWPSRSFVCTAFDTEDGAFKIWDAASRANLARAVASSCAVPGVYPAITIDGRRYFDGGVLSTTNAHLAKGYDAVVVLSVTEILARRAGLAKNLKTPLEREVKTLRDAGADVQIVAFDDAALEIIGVRLMDRTLQPAALREGLRQGRAAAESIRTSAWFDQRIR
jgi:NTE family protein